MRFFSEYSRACGVEKGALLLYDSDRDLYAPWTIVGFDMTTKRKLRLPVTLVADHFTPLTTFRGSGERARFLEEHFSVREFDSLEEVLIVPFHHREEIIGILLIGKSRVSCDDQVDFLLGELDSISDFMFESRELFYTKPEGSMYYSDQALEETKSLIEKTRKEGNKLIIIRLEISPIVDHLDTMLEGADPYRLRKDVLSLISSMIGGSGKVIYSTETYCILLLESRSLTRGRLLLHQIYTSLNTHFSLGEYSLPELSSTERLFPRDGDSAESLLEGLL